MHIVGICGSLRTASCNAGLLRAIARNLPANTTFDIVVPDLPLFNQDIEAPETLPKSVSDFRARVKKGDAYIFATCENNFSVSAPMKNAVDWASRGPDGNLFNDKSAAIIGAGGGMGTLRAQNHMRDISLYLNLHLMNFPQVTAQIFKDPSPFDFKTGELIDKVEEENCAKVITSLVAWNNRLTGKK